MSDAREVLKEHEPLSRESLASREVCEALWEVAGEPDMPVGQTLHGAVHVYRAFDHNPAHQYEIATALAYWDVIDVPEKAQSQGFRHRIHRGQ